MEAVDRIGLYPQYDAWHEWRQTLDVAGVFAEFSELGADQ